MPLPSGSRQSKLENRKCVVSASPVLGWTVTVPFVGGWFAKSVTLSVAVWLSELMAVKVNLNDFPARSAPARAASQRLSEGVAKRVRLFTLMSSLRHTSEIIEKVSLEVLFPDFTVAAK